ncbi:T-lymphocyte activation antigen CD80 isoform X1 [Garra rufa]|uniref:T-lymphocyte activation antigen CD80 isoform X1 n=1 Tax=Garra rufa TaxID=137080 RepID=UPI003CCE84DE
MLNAETEEKDMKPVCSLLALVVTTLLLSAASGHSNELMNITAALGDSVTFRCPRTYSSPVERLYIQKAINGKDDVFINGFFKGRHIQANPEYQNRTEVNEMELSMKMRNVSVSDEGLYKCVAFVDNKAKISGILLDVTAEYSIPTVKKHCSEHNRSEGGAGTRCRLSCSAVGGYPQSTATWPGLNPSLTNVVYNWSSVDNDFKTWTVNQTIIFNCDQPTNVSCKIGGAVSHTITICGTETFPLRVIAAIAFVLVFVLLLIIFVVVMKCCCRRPSNLEGRVNGAEVVPLADCHSQLQNVTTKP